MTMTDAEESGGTPFHRLADYMAIPRVGTLKLSPDGTWLAATVQTLSPDTKKYLTSIWRIDAAGGEARRLTWSAEGEGGPAFLPDGDLLFISRRPDPGRPGPASKAGDPDVRPALWQLPAAGGEARLRTALPGGIAGVATATSSHAIVVSSQVLPAAAPGEQDEERRKQRKDAGVTAILHESAPVRYWDHDLGPAQLRLLAVDDQLTDLTPEPGRALDEQAFELAPDGASVITGWWYNDPAGDSYIELVQIDRATGDRRTLLSDKNTLFDNPKVSPDGRFIACTAETLHSAELPHDVTLMLIGPDGQSRDLLPAFDRHPAEAVWAPDSAALYFTADDDGRRPIFQVDAATGETRRLTADGAHSSLSVDPRGRYLYALRSQINQAPTPVRIDLTANVTVTLDCPGSQLPLPGRLTELETTADDGQRIRGWLVLPDTGQPAPLLLWVHGGPYNSWNDWSWRWNPWLMAARGYAVLLPDPALSTGYGQHMLRRAHRNWGQPTFHDLMKTVDEAIKRPDIDEARTAMMGGSFGGYMANWIAGHTDRFKAIVSHASLWALDQFSGTTDLPSLWWKQLGEPLTSPDVYQENSPHLHIKKISTPMLVIHGDKDYRVPVGEGLRLWADLTRHGTPAKFLYFPDENHWVLTPGNATIWYETVFAFLAQHVLGQAWERPELL
jgi:dipeptidyl aminopeptidase/acylaminoacyl peptidase